MKESRTRYDVMRELRAKWEEEEKDDPGINGAEVEDYIFSVFPWVWVVFAVTVLVMGIFA